MAYRVYLKKKYFDEPDTVSLQATCQLVRDTADKLFGGRVWFLVNDTIEKYYDYKTIYWLDRSTKKIIECVANEENSSIILGNVSGDALRVGFLNPVRLLADVKDTLNKVSFESGKDHFTISIRYPDGEGFTEYEKTFRVRKDGFVLDKMTSRVKFEGNYQYTEWSLSAITFDRVLVTELDKAMLAYKKSYTPEQYPPPEIPLLQTGSAAPFFTGTDFKTGKTVALSDYKGELVLLDFSYMSCYPCVLSIPHLNAVQNAFKDKGLVILSMNSKELEEKDKKPMAGFIEKHAMNYPIILTAPKTDSLYQVSGYPTVYLIDKKGKIVYSTRGFDEALQDSLKQVIDRQ